TNKIKTTIKVLIIGPLMDDIGGTTISFKYLLDELVKTDDVNITVLSVKGIRGCGWRAVPAFINLIVSISLLTSKHDIVSLQVSVTAVPYIGPFILAICRHQKRPLVYRMFGGMDHNALGG